MAATRRPHGTPAGEPGTDQRPAARGGRPRDPSLDDRILAETFALMTEVGYRGLRIDAVAARAGVPKSTIYRRWSSLAELAVDAVDTALGERTPPCTDDPLADLAAAIVRAHSYLTTPPLDVALPQLALELTASPQAQVAYRERVIAPLRDGAVDAVARALAAGRWRGPDPQTSVDMLIGTVAYRLTYLGHVATLEETFTIAEAVAGCPLPRPDAAPGPVPGAPGSS